jgi:hypothetical protein
MNRKWQLYQQLELIPSDLAARYAPRSSVLTWIHRVWLWLITMVSKQSELKVWQERDRFGATSWRVYDPTTGMTANLSSEQEVLAWIESRYVR